MNKITVFLAILLLTLFVTACADVDAPAVRQNALPAGVQAGDLQRISPMAASGDLEALKAQLPPEYVAAVDEYEARLKNLKSQLPADYAGLVDEYGADLDALKSQLPADYAGLVDEYKTALETMKAQLPPEYAAMVDEYAAKLSKGIPASNGPRALNRLPRAPRYNSGPQAASKGVSPKVLQNMPAVNMPDAVTRFPNMPQNKAFTNPPTGPRAAGGGKNAPVAPAKPRIIRSERPHPPQVTLPGRKDRKRNWPQVIAPPFPQKPPGRVIPVAEFPRKPPIVTQGVGGKSYGQQPRGCGLGLVLNQHGQCAPPGDDTPPDPIWDGTNP